MDESLREPPAPQRALERIGSALRRGAPWIFAIDLRSLALFRALLGGTLFVQLCLRLANSHTFLSDGGLLPRAALSGPLSLWRISLHAANGQPGFEAALLVVALIAAAALLLGWRTRLAAVVSFILYVSLMNRAPQLVLGSDMLLGALLFWCCFLPVNARWSLDLALADEASVPPSPQRSWAGSALLIQGAMACMLSTWMAVGADPLGQMLQQPAYLSAIGGWGAQHGLFTPWMHSAVRWIGGLGPLLLFTPVLRKAIKGPIWVALVFVQIAAIFTLELGPAPWVACVALAPFVGSSVWARLQAVAARKAPLQVYSDAARPAARRWQQLWCTMLALPHARLRAAQDTPRTAALLSVHARWIVIDANDRAHLGGAAYLAMLRRSPLLGPLGALLLACHADKAWNGLARRLDRFRFQLPPPRAAIRAPGAAPDRIAGLVLILVLVWNLGTLGALPAAVHTALAPPLRLLRLDQNWANYLPRGPQAHGWLAAVGTTASGAQVDAMRGHGSMDFTPPRRLAAREGSIRSHTWHDRLLQPGAGSARTRTAHYLCQRWLRRAPHAPLQSIDLVYLVEDAHNVAGTRSRLEQHVLWSGSCQGASRG